MDRLAALRARCRSLVSHAALLSHEFFNVIQSGNEFGRAALLRWSQEDYWVARAFPGLLGSLIANVPHVEARHMLVRNLWEESGQGRLPVAHFSLYQAFLTSIGVDLPSDEARSDKFINLQVRFAECDPVLGVAAFCYASEYLCLFEFDPITKAVEHYFPGADVRYLNEIRMDVRHTAELEKTLSLLLGNSYNGTRDADIEEAVIATLKARQEFYDRVMAQVLSKCQGNGRGRQAE